MRYGDRLERPTDPVVCALKWCVKFCYEVLTTVKYSNVLKAIFIPSPSAAVLERDMNDMKERGVLFRFRLLSEFLQTLDVIAYLGFLIRIG